MGPRQAWSIWKVRTSTVAPEPSYTYVHGVHVQPMTFRRAWTAAALVAAMGPAMAPAVGAVLSRDLKFSTVELIDLERGRIVKHTLDKTSPGEVAVAGAVRVNATRETFLSRFRDITQFKRGPGVLEIGRFGDPPTLGDLEALTIDKNDFDGRACRVGDCGVRLPAATIRRFQREIDWKAPDADRRAVALFKQVLFEHVRAYLSASSDRFIQYDDDKRPVRPVEEFAGILKNSAFLGELVPGLPAHLASRPSHLPGVEDFLYWSKETGGFAPFITVTQVTIARAAHGSDVITSKDVYSSRYVDSSLAVTIASDVIGTPDAFYLVYVNRSRASAMKGPFSGLRHAMVERRAKSSLEDNLKLLKGRLERR